jgi:ribosomal protein S1
LEEIENYSIGQNLKLVIHKLDRVNQRITLNLPQSDVNNEIKHKITKGFIKETIAEKKKRTWIENKDKMKAGMKYNGKIVHKGDFGYIVEFENGLDGLLHITKVPKSVELNLNQSVDVLIIKVDFGKQQMSLKL